MEILVSLVILSLLIMMLVSMVNQTSSVWRHTNAKIEQFREAREGFESLARRLSQATLNTYWDYDNPAKPNKYIRQAELRFISGPGLVGDANSTPPRPTHSTFFFAPLGFVQDGKTDSSKNPYQGLDFLLNTWGYYVEFNSDKGFKPPFVKSPDHKRFRLVEFMQPSQSLELYKLEGTNLKYNGREWFLNGVNPASAPTAPKPPTHILADNIIAIVLLPKASKDDLKAWGGGYNDTSLAPRYLYDSTGTQMTTKADARLNPINQLPPIVQVSMVAIDEASAIRMSDSDNTELLQKLGGLFNDPAKLKSDLVGIHGTADDSLAQYLIGKRINYRVFTGDVSIRGAKWSTAQTN